MTRGSRRMRYPSEEAKEKARELRRRATPADRVLWEALRNQQLAGLTFRRQHPVGAFVADFCCSSRRLIVELDGGIHDNQVEYDVARTELIEARGYLVLRVPNEDVIANLPRVLEHIATTAAARQPFPVRTSDVQWGEDPPLRPATTRNAAWDRPTQT